MILSVAPYKVVVAVAVGSDSWALSAEMGFNGGKFRGVMSAAAVSDHLLHQLLWIWQRLWHIWWTLRR